MQLAELEGTLPHGFHDAVLEAISVDYASGTATLSLRLWIGLLPPARVRAGQAPVQRRCHVLVTGLLWIAIDPPANLVSLEGGINVSGASEPAEAAGRFPQLPGGASVYAFFAEDWNSYLYVAARGAEIAWEEPEEDAWARAEALERGV